MSHSDTIVAPATPSGHGSIGILRISGDCAVEVARQVLGKIPRPRYANYLLFLDENGCMLDKGIALWFPAPHSFTGEDVLELQGHGGPVVLDLLLRRILLVPGLRMAHPGEFSERAFLNEKLDLTQAEAIADLINASSEKAVRAAVCSLQGVFSVRIKTLVASIIDLRMHIEAMLDFPDEEVSSRSNNNIVSQLNNIASILDIVRNEAHLGSLLHEGRRVVIAGKSNAGKSSLFNRLCGRKAALVTALAGTTRDVLHERIYIDGLPLHVIDTAGIRKSSEHIENMGIALAFQEIKKADHILFVVDGATTRSITLSEILPDFIDELKDIPPFTILRNKSDITHEAHDITKTKESVVISLSARTGEGFENLMAHLRAVVSDYSEIEDGFLARRRHVQALELAATYLENGKNNIVSESAKELLAEDLRLAQLALNEITGEFSSQQLLDSIFSSFCIGK
ncbi:tRNA uridine-5-carboxymethylaminomethyl(34) synthesis GTPase MnmE [Candidatus Erwinia haradaeae]|uniref:tRNA modification GTPase MnmE n=1 Tax=Candidatus Erwinia haradaeae TaxID=1922217 RepID=A0A451DAE3_9GAMM|nr:tRNA uridine-5-carboxymethylaminomethyl(34) synthesis GTPase MnmE [Candidatus Erwinia haradaeae]VFP83288.1 tRNA modification GTPase MnmE [Candidatus Erwinia haradaeae]